MSLYTHDLRKHFGAELIVSDGGSTDDSVSIAKQHADVVVTHNEERRQTIAEGRNKGAAAARGNVLVFINGDTIPAEVESFFHHISKFEQQTGKYGRYAALACSVHFPPGERRLADRLFHTFYNGYVWFLNIIRIGAGRGECQIVRRDVFLRVGGYRDRLAAGEDFDLYARISRRARVRFAGELLVLESPRRFRKFGYLRVLFWWTVNALSVLLRGRSSSDEWEPVR